MDVTCPCICKNLRYKMFLIYVMFSKFVLCLPIFNFYGILILAVKKLLSALHESLKTLNKFYGLNASALIIFHIRIKV